MGMLAPLHPGPADLVWRTVHKLCNKFKKKRFPKILKLVICEQFLVFDVMFGPVQVCEVKAGIVICLSSWGGSLGFVHYLPEAQGGMVPQLGDHRGEDSVKVAGQLHVVPEQVDGLLVPHDCAIEQDEPS